MSGRTHEAPNPPMATRVSSRGAILLKFEEECSRFKVGLRIQIARLDRFEGTEMVTGEYLKELGDQARLLNGLALQIADAFSSTSTIQGRAHTYYKDFVPIECRALTGILPELGSILRDNKPGGARRVSDRLKRYLEKTIL
ncbi:hypothetical protein N7499_000346 [Penicillium canescens]|uniref:Uncharacterized protein n=1 Tax=Penicillium canescens TaxID=5083 RepID=A0AAD6IIG6_PENCN|nr:uncharacterized protein N7446_011454 [Penicillium canescens]KAJ6004277.1 hypothetical protein N7522_005922 [Penicillium canescens]KAJ6029201.1 hypothetical protein N7444_012188 [Penicillium canescens]KAJ6047632.1 hypothetical protein N7460_003779 [Penicillium canescens]KAJ6048771.1 hypothetical protein N7446_011454 [Penicillium canescens]KAJ6100716.1 hypothetical protein N7499_000346 [Penicillium canescens]